MVNLILGLGGTGAKVVESFIHCCAAGLGPDQASVVLLDQDKSNGNTQRACETLARYMDAREMRPAGETRCDLLRTDLTPHPEPASPDKCRWVPQDGREQTLAELMALQLLEAPLPRDLAHVFFHADKGGEDREELEMRLHEGYRGRPHVGSAALMLRLESDDFWKSVVKIVRDSDKVRVFLCGSVFGGTGAATLPTLARRLRQEAIGEGRPLRTAGALMLPYFTFPSSKEDGKENVAASNELLFQSQTALRYYHTEMVAGGEPYGFDDLYLIGWNPPISLKYHSAGSENQRNPPLAPELFAALAAARFFVEAGEGYQGRQPPSMRAISRGEGRRLVWEDLPGVPERRGTESAYAAWLRFCWLWHYNYGGIYGDSSPKGAEDESWARQLLGDSPNAHASQAGKLGAYVKTALEYAMAMSVFSSSSDFSFDLWDQANAASGNPGSEGESAPRVTLPKEGLRKFPDLVKTDAGLPSAADVYWDLARRRPKDASGDRSLWRLALQLHESATPRLNLEGSH